MIPWQQPTRSETRRSQCRHAKTSAGAGAGSGSPGSPWSRRVVMPSVVVRTVLTRCGHDRAESCGHSKPRPAPDHGRKQPRCRRRTACSRLERCSKTGTCGRRVSCVSTSQHRHVGLTERRENIPRLDQVGDSEDDAKHDADASNNNISNAKEGIASAHHSPGGYDDGLGARIYVGRKV